MRRNLSSGYSYLGDGGGVN